VTAREHANHLADDIAYEIEAAVEDERELCAQLVDNASIECETPETMSLLGRIATRIRERK